jgi:hypothetical protein
MEGQTNEKKNQMSQKKAKKTIKLGDLKPIRTPKAAVDAAAITSIAGFNKE